MGKFAPQYGTRERVLFALKVLAVAAPVYFGCFYWLIPWLEHYMRTASCDRFGAFNGLQLLLFGMFVVVPLLFAAMIWLLEGARSLQVWRLGQSPLPGEKTLRKTRYRFGKAARIRPLAVFALIALLIGLALGGGFVIPRVAAMIGACDHPERSQLPLSPLRKPRMPALELVISASR